MKPANVSFCGMIRCITFLTILCTFTARAQVIARFHVENIQNRLATPVFVSLDELAAESDSLLLLEVKGKQRVPVPFQVETGTVRRGWFTVRNEGESDTRLFELVKIDERTASTARAYPPVVELEDRNGALVITDQGKDVLQYNYQTVAPPDGADSLFHRSGFIHPLWSPAGNVLTRISPWDHPHHFGIWNPWTHTVINGQTVDFWNLAKGEGTVRFAAFIEKTAGAVFGGFKALQEHILLDTVHGKHQTALNETWDVRVFHVGEGVWLWELTSVLNCAGTDTVLLEKYDYGGFGFRATESWNKDKSKALTSDGKGRNDGNATRARWCMIDGETASGRSGILFMGHPANYNFPEPIRIYPEDALFGSGDVFFSFSPTITRSWKLSPGRNHVLKYRMLVFEDTLSREQAEATWYSFAHPPTISIEKQRAK